MNASKVVILIMVIGILSGCAGAQPNDAAIQTAIAQTAAAQDVVPPESPTLTKTPRPTYTPWPPSNTPAPTRTRAPTSTRKPTNTATPIPEPIVLTGSGDSIVDFDNPFKPAIVHIVGNSASRYFGVTSYDANNEMLDLLVNTTDPYDGIVLQDLRDDENTVRYEIQASGEWSITISDLTTARRVEAPGSFAGIGDDVVVVYSRTNNMDKATIKGNQESRYFSVMTFSNDVDLPVNTTDPYEGTVILPNERIVVFVITATGEWEIIVETR